MRGMGDVWDWNPIDNQLPPADVSSPSYPASNTPPTNNADWTGIVSTAISTWGNLETAKLNSQTQIATAPYQYGYARPASSVPASYNMLAPGAGISTGTLILLGAAAVALILMMKD